MRTAYAIGLLWLAMAATAQQRLTVYFDFDHYDLNESARKQLNTWVASGDRFEVTKIYGFCDWKGTNPYNDSLSVKRVNTVRDYLKEHAIPIRPDYISRGFGEDFEQSQVQSENRKVIIVYEERADVVKPSAPTLTDRIKNAKTGDKLTLPSLYFFNMSSRILPESKPTLYDLLCALQENPKLRIEIQGHICCQPSGDINNISVLRARAVYNYLISNKINRKRLSYRGFGVSQPIHSIPEQNEQERDENRRVEILIVDR